MRDSLPNPPIRFGRRPRRPKEWRGTRPLRGEEPEAVRAVADSRRARSRIPLCIVLSLVAGGTATEIANLRWEDIDLDAGTVTFSGPAARTVPLDEWGVATIRRFLHQSEAVDVDESPWVMPNTDRPQAVVAVTYALGQALRFAGIFGRLGVTARSLRLTAGLRVLEADGIEAATKFLGMPRLDTAAHALHYDWSSGPRVRQAQAPMRKLTDLQWLEAIACFKPLWDVARHVDSLLAAQASDQHGRAPKHSAFETLLFEVAAWQLGTYSSVGRTLADPLVWDRLCSAVEAAFPDDPRMRLSTEPINRKQNYWFRTQRVSDAVIDVMDNMITEAAIAAAQSMGMLVPGLESSPVLDKRSFVAADGCWIPARTRSAQGVTPSGAANRKRDSVAHHRLVTVLTRNPHYQERVVLSAHARPFRSNRKPPNEAAMVVQTILDLVERFPNLRAGLKGVVHDRMPSRDSDRLLDAGLIPVANVPLTDRRFAQAAALRQDCESLNWQIKRTLGRSYGCRHIEFKGIAFQAHVLITALAAYHNRTGADMTAWFGQHQLPTVHEPADQHPATESN